MEYLLTHWERFKFSLVYYIKTISISIFHLQKQPTDRGETTNDTTDAYQ